METTSSTNQVVSNHHTVLVCAACLLDAHLMGDRVMMAGCHRPREGPPLFAPCTLRKGAVLVSMLSCERDQS